ncbi:MAG: MinD/ParA family protein [SAR324 cluster bacterium]|nr:MinD/ParA family protein [SAR324 cluster bacterium]
MDQATTLRKIVNLNKFEEGPQPKLSGRMRVIAITSGKGGVGTTNIVLNLCMALSSRNRRVLLLDADMGLANVDVLLGLTPKYTLEHVMKRQKDVRDIMLTGPAGFRILPSGSGISELSEMTYEQQMHLFQELSKIDDDLDYLFIDTGAGISSNVLRFNASANEILIIANPEPTSITDAYALMKLLAIKYHIRDFGLIANSVTSRADGQGVYDTLERVCSQFLKVNLNFLGWIPFDANFRRTVRQQKPLLELYPDSPAAKSISRIADLLDSHSVTQLPPQAAAGAEIGPEKASSFWDRLLHWKKM